MIETIFNFILLEGVLGGGGRTFSIGTVGLRIPLFVIGVLTWISAVLFTGRQRDGVQLSGLLIVIFFVSLVPGLLQDAANGTAFRVIAGELQPLLFWLIAPLFAMGLQTERNVRTAKNIILYGGFTVALMTLLFTLGIRYGLIGFGTVYAWADRTEELFFRSGNTFFYKGHFYVGAAFVFCLILLPR